MEMKNSCSQVICVAVVWMLANGVLLMGAEVNVPAAFIFGDSLTDVGNNNHLTYGLAKANFLWYGIDFPGGAPTGRFSNGRTINDIIFSKLNIPTPKAYLSLSDKDDAILNGANYASGGAGILNETGFLFIERVAMDKQVECFEATKKRITNKLGEKAANELLAGSLYFVLIGSNDYINNYLLPVPSQVQQYDPHEFINLLITSLQRQLKYDPHEFVDLFTTSLQRQFKQIYEIGARKIVFNGMGPLGCIPSQRLQNPAGDNSCLDDVNTWAQKFNVEIMKVIKQLNSELPGVRISYVDTYNLLMELIQNPNKYGFDVADAPCCKVDTQFGQFCFPNSSLCRDRSKYLFWDAFHPSDAANEIMAHFVLSHPDALQFYNSPAPAPAPAPTLTSPSPSP